jgi:ATP-dependent Clp protease ATP-binding subunit ClpC
MYFDIIRNMEIHDLAVQADRMAALGNEARLGILKLLLDAYPGEASAGDIGRATGIPNSTLSHHLERLRREGLVSSRKEKQWIWYSVNTTTLGDLLNFLYHDCCSGCGVEIETRAC